MVAERGEGIDWVAVDALILLRQQEVEENAPERIPRIVAVEGVFTLVYVRLKYKHFHIGIGSECIIKVVAHVVQQATHLEQALRGLTQVQRNRIVQICATRD